MKKLILTLVTGMLLVLWACNNDNGSGSGDTTIDRSGNLLASGASANDILSNASFTKLVLEIAYVEGFRPTQQAIDGFTEFFRTHTFKEDIEIVYRELSSPNEETLSLREVIDLEDENRTLFNAEDTLAIYIYFTDAPSDEDDEDEGTATLGAVYRNTSMIIYESTVRNLASLSSAISNADVEVATLNHEGGHLLGLVDLGTPMVSDHEDDFAENHCTVEGCLMRAELQFGGTTMKLLQSRASKGLVTTPSLDAQCILDLQVNGGR